MTHRIRKRIRQFEEPDEVKQFCLTGLRKSGVSPAKVYRIEFVRNSDKKLVGCCDSWDDFEKAFDDAVEVVNSADQININLCHREGNRQ